MKNNISVLHVIHWPRSGIVSLIKDLIVNYQADLLSVHVVFFENDAAAIKEFKTITDSTISLNYSKRKIQGLKQLVNIIDRIKPDIIHTHSFLPSLCIKIINKKKIKVLRTVHNNYPYFHNRNIKSVIKRLLELYAVTGRNNWTACVSAAVYEALPWKTKVTNSIIIKNGISISHLNDRIKESIENEMHLFDDRPVIISLGRLEYQKGFDLLIKGFSIVKNIIPNAKLIIIGTGTQKQYLQNLINSLNLEEDAVLLGFRSNPIPYLHKADLFVCSSRHEGLPISIIEALATGTNVVATNVDGVPEVIHDYKTGFLVEDINEDSIADKIIEVLDNRVNLNTHDNGIIEYVIDNFNITNTAKEYFNVYEIMLSS